MCSRGVPLKCLRRNVGSWESAMKTMMALLLAMTPVQAQVQSAQPTRTGRVNVGDAMIAYASTGAGQPIVFIHGYAQHLGIWDDQVAAFSPRYRVIRYDVRGFGQSGGHMDPSANPDDLRQLLDGLGIRKAHIVGLSMGANVALRFAVLFPDRVEKLVLYGAPPTPDAPPPTELFQLFSTLPELAKTHGLDTVGKLIMESPLAWMPPDRPELKESLYREWSKYEGRDLLDPRPPSGRTPEINLSQVSRIRVPTLILNGDHEVPSFMAFADTLLKRIPRARRVIITDGGHGAHFAQPDQFNKALRDFFLGVSARP
jgi:pimeloyl-ACP methyl ester carboxylesterase